MGRHPKPFTIAAINLSDLYRRLGRDNDGEGILRTALTASPRDAAVRHALGLTLTRLKRSDEALAEFQAATTLELGNPHYAYVYAVALHSGGRPAEAVAVLNEAPKSHPNDRNILSALVAFARTGGNAAAALAYAERIAVITPQDRNLARLIDEVRQAAKSTAQ
ncbi:tetratricopeptide repeat protein [Bradyrhizobium sp. 200]|uniref:tetratricopeptide repeat protein n=1 Tax=Bradyrhizobium sp. 200 TaxID=2782665 RepID=UPI001FFF89DF|nr:tetratricopeptide repeat protein [Bradyrhizobium sp. 200]UPJ48733.1 tetratricopeptide repeat protein [Bradyrhizobium sp. 200]